MTRFAVAVRSLALAVVLAGPWTGRAWAQMLLYESAGGDRDGSNCEWRYWQGYDRNLTGSDALT